MTEFEQPANHTVSHNAASGEAMAHIVSDEELRARARTLLNVIDAVPELPDVTDLEVFRSQRSPRPATGHEVVIDSNFVLNPLLAERAGEQDDELPGAAILPFKRRV